MNDLVKIIKQTVMPNFLNIRTSIKAYDRDALCCGAPCWRWAYHALHSADKWFINPNVYEEPAFHEEGMDNPDNPTSVVLSDEQLLEYLDSIEKKTLDYLDTLSDDMLYECPENCRFTRMELVLRQYRHLSFHTGMLNGQTDDYYRMLENGLLRDYFEHNAADRETYYFRGMYLRLLRAIDFMTQQPEWDGRRILVIGESQGGGQAVAAASLDPRVSAVVLNVPAMQDFGGTRVGRRGGWPHPIETHQDISPAMLDATLPYFDGALLIRHSKAEVYCEIGLIDTTCPPSAVWSSLNGAPGKKTVNCVPFRTHAWPSGRWRAYWEEHFLHPREQFIADYLK
jgi:hypothetical protein